MLPEIAEKALVEGEDQVGLSPPDGPAPADDRQAVGGDFIGGCGGVRGFPWADPSLCSVPVFRVEGNDADDVVQEQVIGEMGFLKDQFLGGQGAAPVVSLLGEQKLAPEAFYLYEFGVRHDLILCLHPYFFSL